MKVLKVLVLLVMVGMLVGADTQKEKPDRPKVVKKEVKVEGNKSWINTGLSVKPNDRVTITATGQVCFSSGDSDSCVGPDGYKDEHGPYNQAWPNDYLQCDDPLPNENHASLIADIGQMFFVGGNKTFKGKNGYLYLGINDCSLTGDCYNTSSFTVKILIEKNVAASPEASTK